VEERCTVEEWCGEAARRRGSDLVDVRDAMTNLTKNALSFNRMRRTKNHPTLNKKLV
jgi:hypothetical protein